MCLLHNAITAQRLFMLARLLVEVEIYDPTFPESDLMVFAHLAENRVLYLSSGVILSSVSTEERSLN
jgi:hypothetical protein